MIENNQQNDQQNDQQNEQQKEQHQVETDSSNVEPVSTESNIVSNKPLTGAEKYAQKLAIKQRIQELTCELESLKYPNDKYDMGILDSVYRTVIKKYVTIGGRASRSELWEYVLFYYMVFAAIGTVTGFLNILLGNIIASFFIIYMFVFIGAHGLLLPTLAVQVRRLHDIGKSGWYMLVSMVPFVGGLLLLYWFVQPSEAGPNEYGNKTSYIEITPDMSRELRLSTTPSSGYRWLMVGILMGLIILSIVLWAYSLSHQS